FYRCFCGLLKCGKSNTSSNRCSSKSTRVCRSIRRQDNNFTFVAASAEPPSSDLQDVTVGLQNPEQATNNGPKAKPTVLLVAHYSA
ncbi:hypothetical protein JRQ81_017941, partial [Phrynocephalus forsythii]